MDTESGAIPVRCDSTLSVIKIQPATRNKKGNFPLVSQKFSDPEIEELYQLHSTNQKRTELFRCFLYAVLFYCIAQIVVHSFWVVYYHQLKPPEGYGHTNFYDNSPEHATQTRSQYLPAEELETKISALLKRPLGGERRIPIVREKSHHHDQAQRFSAVATEMHHPVFINHNTNVHHNRSINNWAEKSEPLKSQPPLHPLHTRLKHIFHLSSLLEGPQSLLQAPTRRSHSRRQHNIISSNDYLENTNSFGRHGSRGRRRSKRSSPRTAKVTVHDGHQEDGVRMEHGIAKNHGDMCYIVTTMICLAATSIVVLFMLLPLHGCSRNPHVPVLFWSTTIFLTIALRTDFSIPLRTGLGWIVLETFLIWVTLPLRIQSVMLYTIPLAITHTVIVVIKGKNQNFIGLQLGANLIILATTNVLGLLSFYLSDKKQRRAFMDTRQSLEMKLVIEEQAKEQERLLLSVLPEHLALKMRQDLGAAVDGQFKKIYMSRHENVSILYADIVGFTAISSTYSASELVKILNELFARFDRLAEKYSQLRIKILGDCYYCICGAPEERSDHAVLCVHMGLSMVKSIKDRFKVQVGIDMRVGIHTGAILAGVMGQRQWQFDVYSKDVELANKMESSGVAGRVHVSEKTLSFLNDEFEVEPGHGEKREEILRISGIKTYFIVRVIKPFSENTTAITENGELQPDDLVTKDMPSDLNSTFAEDSNSAAEENHVPRKASELENYSQRLKEELLSRDGYKDLSRQTQWLTLSFQDKVKESEFTVHKEPYAGISSLACPLALLAIAIATFFVISFGALILVTAIIGLVLLLFLSCLSSWNNSAVKAESKSFSVTLNFFNSLCSPESKSKLWARRIITTATMLVLTAANLIFLDPCIDTGRQCANSTIFEDEDTEIQPPLVLPKTSSRPFSRLGCVYPAYAFIFCSFFLMSITLLAHPLSWLKSLSILIVVVAHILFISLSPVKDAVQCSETLSFHGGTDLIPEVWYLTVFLGVVFLVLFTLNRRLEKSSRVLFLWKTEVEQQRERATQLRQKNEALVYNILPQHVASHFLGARKRKHEELYSQSYSEVGILFASMPNFSDFYSEETVNNQGLECLRFLNEVISDFDALLELPKFSDNIIKIKTIGSTYMAASGLNPSKQAKSDEPIKQRWSHLSLLVEFAFELKRALTSINEQSFNHFVLKMGINNGPATGGVIGASKPHYDIWGNSVNVASRMESTGKAGCIQVTEETYRILRIYGYNFEQRGLVNVKGKGQLMTYYLIGRGPDLSDEQMKQFLAEASTEATNHLPPVSETTNSTNTSAPPPYSK